MRDMIAVCHDCRKRHGLTLEQFLHTNSVRDWEMKHRGHTIEFLDAAAYEVSISQHAVNEYRHNADIKMAYAVDLDYTITLSNLAESSTLLVGRQSVSVSNTANLYLDVHVSGHITTGTSPTVDEAIQVIAVGAEDDTPTWPTTDTSNSLDGTDSQGDFISDNVKDPLARIIAHMSVDATSDRPYGFGPVSLAQLFGKVPTHHLVWVSHDTDVNLETEAGTTHVITYTGIYATV